MRFRWAVALSLLIPVVAGCQSALPVRPATTSRWSAEVRNVPTESQTQPATGEDVTLARFEEPKSFPTPPMDGGGEQEAVTLADFEGIAFRNNPTLAAAAARIDSARGRQVQAGLYPNTVIGYHATEIGNLGTAGQQGGFISQRFITGGKLRLDRAIAGKQIDEAHSLFHAQKQRVLSDVRVRFYDAVVAQKRVQLTQELARIGDEVVSSSKKLLDGRQISENDLLQAEIEAEQSYILLDNAHNQNSEAWRRLAAVIGIPTMQPTPLAGELDADILHDNWEDCYSLALAGNPELIAAQTRVERARLSITRAHKENIPDIDLWVSVRHHNITNSDVANVQVGIPIPILNRNQGNITRSESEWVEAINEVTRIELDLQDRLAVTHRQYVNARQQVDRYKVRILPRAKRSLDLTTNGYHKGQIDYLTLIVSQRTFIRVNLAYLDALRDLQEATSIIEGQLLSGSLTSRI